MPLDDEALKNTVVTILSNYISPRQLGFENSIATTITLYEMFYPFSTTISTAKFYVAGSIGTPTGITIDITAENATFALSRFTITPVVGWNTLTVNKNVISRKAYYLKFYPNDTSNYYNIGASTVSTPYKFYKEDSLQTNNLSFEITIPTFIYKAYTPTTISTDKYPVMSVDIEGRANIEHPYIKPDIARHKVSVRINIYSKYNDELDRLAYYIEKAMHKKKINYVDDTYLISAGNISSVSQFRDNILQKSKSFIFDMFISETID